MIQAAQKALVSFEKKPRILGVSVLTSFNDFKWSEMTRALNGHASQVESSVASLVDAGVAWGLSGDRGGIVCSAHELSRIRSVHRDLYTVVPGIRPTGSTSNDQARTMTPKEAREYGASAIVVGRPITQAPKESGGPRDVVAQILKDLV